MGLTALAGAAIVGGIGSAVIGSQASKSAANAQVRAAQTSSDTQLQMFDRMQSNLQPFMQQGMAAGNALTGLMGLTEGGNPATSPLLATYPGYQNFAPTMQQLEQTPGYQFTLNQGLKGVNNAMSAQGLAGSGAQMRGIADYTTGLASNTYQTQLDNYMKQYQLGFGAFNTAQTNVYNRLSNLMGIGQAAATNTANLGTQVAAGVGNNIIGAGNASAAGTIGAANAMAGGLNSALGGASQAYLTNQLLSRLTTNPAAAGGLVGG